MITDGAIFYSECSEEAFDFNLVKIENRYSSRTVIFIQATLIFLEKQTVEKALKIVKHGKIQNT